jgi:hypothetical protein
MFTAGQEIEQTQKINYLKKLFCLKCKTTKILWNWSCSKSNDVELLQNQDISLKFQKNKFWPIEELEEYFSLTIRRTNIYK